MPETVLKELIRVEILIVEDHKDKALELVKTISKRKGLSKEDKFACVLVESRINLILGENERALKEAEKI